MLTIGALAVRNEFCEAVESADGLKYVMDAMIQFPDSAKVDREALKLLKVLAGNDKVKVKIVQSGAVTVIASALDRFKVCRFCSYFYNHQRSINFNFFYSQMKP